MSKFVLSAVHEDEYGNPTASVTSQFDAERLDDVLGYIQDFLHGVGYYFKGELNVEEYLGDQ